MLLLVSRPSRQCASKWWMTWDYLLLPGITILLVQSMSIGQPLRLLRMIYVTLQRIQYVASPFSALTRDDKYTWRVEIVSARWMGLWQHIAAIPATAPGRRSWWKLHDPGPFIGRVGSVGDHFKWRSGCWDVISCLGFTDVWENGNAKHALCRRWSSCHQHLCLFYPVSCMYFESC